MNDHRTIKNPVLRTSQTKTRRQRQAQQLYIRNHHALTRRSSAVTMPSHSSQQPPRVKKRAKPARSRRMWLLLLPVITILTVLFALLLIVGAIKMAYADKILPQVRSAGMSLGNMTPAQASATLNQQWQTLQLSDGTRSWTVPAAQLGIALDTVATAERAFEQGHGIGGLTAFFRPVSVPPVIQIDDARLIAELNQLAGDVNRPARNAGIRFVDGEVQSTAALDGSQLDVNATVRALHSNPASIADGELHLTMQAIPPTVTDASHLLEQARMLLSRSLNLRVFDPVTGDSVHWTVPPTTWADWLIATPSSEYQSALTLTADENAVQTYLQAQVDSTFDASRTLDFEAAQISVQTAIATDGNAVLYVKHRPRTHVVGAGESITSIAWDYGIPYLYLIQANDHLERIDIGQTIHIPPADYFIGADPDPNKRIVVSISQQRTYVYENDTLIYDWVASTGIHDSPTWTGVYQILSHEPNAYAGNWDLYMPHFMGVYQPVPGSLFTNGFHGFPTRGGGQLLWENNLGSRVTYGCILLSNTHIQTLYDWADNGVIVEIQP